MRAWLDLLALILAALASPRMQLVRHSPATAATRQARRPGPAKTTGITVMAGRAVYACTVVPAPKARH